ncbi:hypothetical protein ABZS66_22405 [Dactylosporangium sp. NPDC005572]|uniref:hypothetical protein n=1 Tax=Dactylosporangium sp. NPDC005572 TaxID=3156889 RepID=UPI0033B9F797
MTAPRRDPWRAVRKSVAQAVVLFTAVFVFGLGRAVFGVGPAGDVERSTAAWTVWSVGVALMVAGSVVAVQYLRGKSGIRWCVTLWVTGLVLTLIYSSMIQPPPVQG